MSLILKPLLYLCSTIFRRLPQGSKMASAAPAIISIYQRQKEGQECMCLLSPIYPNSDQLSALLLFYLLSVSAGWLVWATSVAFLPLALWWVQPIQSMEGDENVRREWTQDFFPSDSLSTKSHLAGCLSLPEGHCSQGSLLYPTLSLPVQK